MKRLRIPAPVVMGAAIVLILDAIVLAAAAWNRSGVPDSQLELTERELALPAYMARDDTGLFLAITLNRGLNRDESSWFDRAKMKEIGFDVHVDPADPEAAEFYGFAAARSAFVVLEYEGEAWRKSLADIDRRLAELQADAAGGAIRQERAAAEEKKLKASRVAASHLFAVDAGLDRAALRQRYPDRGRFAIVEGAIVPRFIKPETGPAHFGAPLVMLMVSQVRVPQALRPLLSPYKPKILPREARLAEEGHGEAGQDVHGWTGPPRYRAGVAFGRRLEPWLVDVQPLEVASDGPSGP